VTAATHISGNSDLALKFIVREFSLKLWLLLILSASTAVAAPREPRFVPGRILVQPASTLSETNLVTKLNRHGANTRRPLHRLNARVVDVPEENAEAVLTALRRDPDIEFAERDFIAEATFAPNDPYVVAGNEWHLARIQSEPAWNFTAGRSDTVVAVLDSGVNAVHPDLAGQLLRGYDFVNNDADPADDFGHGTAVAGTVAAAGNNGAGVAGVAFGCRVLPVKIVDASGFATYSCMAQGIRYAVDQGARVINLSVAGDAPSLLLQQAVDYAWNHNVVIVASAGNNADDLPRYPAACDHVLGVSATAADDSLARFSSYGNHVTLSAPGDGIWTTQRDPANPYGAWRGTSFSSPIVAAVSALIASENPALANSRIVSILKQTADDLGNGGYDPLFGYGRVNALRALSAASSEPGALPPSPPEPGPNPPGPNTNAPNSFASIKGNYTGLVVNTNEVNAENSGYFSLTIAASGRFSGKLLLAGKRHGFRGQFDGKGQAATVVKRGPLRALTLTLHVDFAEVTDRIAGRLTDGAWVSELAGDRDVFHAKWNPAPQAGLRAFILERADDTALTAAITTISTSGSTRIKGQFDDGRAFITRSALAKNGDFPFYLSLKRGSEMAIGWLNFPEAPSPTATGTVLWIRSGTNAFTATLQAASAGGMGL
jgi:subtilisin family serine protease